MGINNGLQGRKEATASVAEEGDSFSVIKFWGEKGVVSIFYEQTPKTYTKTKQLRKIFADQGEMLDEESISLVQWMAQEERKEDEQPEVLESILRIIDIKIKEREQIKNQQRPLLLELTSDVLRQQNDLLQEIVKNFLEKVLLNQTEFLEEIVKSKPLHVDNILKLKDTEIKLLEIVVGIMRNELTRIETDVDSLCDIDENLLKDFTSQMNIYKDFASTLRHDYRLLLGNMFSFADLMKRLEEGDEMLDVCKGIILAAPKKLQEMLNNRIILLKDPEYKEHNVLDIFNEGIEQLNGNAIGKKIIIKNELKIEKETLFSDKAHIAAFLHTFLINAVKFTPDGGEIRIASKKTKEGYIEISVTDTGKGMSLAKLKELKALLSEEGEIKVEKLEPEKGVNGEIGTGMGLVNTIRLSNKLVFAKLEVEAEGEGKGATFSFIVPATEEQHNKILQEGGVEFEENVGNTVSNVKEILNEQFE